MKPKDFAKKHDPANLYQTLIETHTQIDAAWNRDLDLAATEGVPFESVVVTGLGGSAIAGDVMADFLGDDLALPWRVNRDYRLPAYVNEKTLVVVSSYSGDTEETLSSLKDAMAKNAKIVCITSGGAVAATAKAKGLPLVDMPKGFQPRYALGASFFSLLKVLEALNVAPPSDALVEEIRALWKRRGEEYAEAPNRAFDVAATLIGKTPAIYSAVGVTEAAGWRFKGQLNENAKTLAFHAPFPEMNHNEIVGWETVRGELSSLVPIYLPDTAAHPRTLLRFEIVERILGKSGVESMTLQGEGEDRRVRLMDLVYLLDWVSYWLAVLRGYDPGEIDNIMALKKELSEKP
jgi:glucose/mannose-6-phosphate isomerase